MKIRITLPTNEEFFQKYAGLVPTLNKLGYLAQVVSALTEVGILYALTRNAVADITSPLLANIAGFVGAILGTAFIEVGLRKFLPFAVRQILNKRFAGLDMVMSVAIFASCLLLLGASGTLSFFGSKETVASVVPPAKTEGTGAIDTTVNSHRQINLASYRRDSTAIANRYASQMAALEMAHKAAADAAGTKLKGIEGKERNTGQSFASQKVTIKQSMADAAAAHAMKLASLTEAGAKEMQALQDEHNALEADLNRERSEWMTALKESNQAAEAKRQKQVSAWGGSVAWFTVLCLVILLLAVALQEVHAHGSGMQEESIPNEYFFRESPYSAFMGALTERIHATMFGWIKAFEEKTPEPPEPGKPPTVYEYEQKVERRPIGFTTGKTIKESSEKSSGVSSGVSSVSRETQAEIDNLKRRLKAYEEREKAGVSKERIVAYDFRKETNLKTCEHCQTSFVYRHAKQKYCSEDCRKNHWESINGRKPYMRKGGKL